MNHTTARRAEVPVTPLHPATSPQLLMARAWPLLSLGGPRAGSSTTRPSLVQARGRVPSPPGSSSQPTTSPRSLMSSAPTW